MLFEDALKEARDEAHKEGREELKKEIILRMHEEGFEIDLIARTADLPPEKVRKIIEDKKSV